MSVVCVRMDDDTKKQFETFCRSVGITVSAAVNMFAKMTIREDRLPFDVRGASCGSAVGAKKVPLYTDVAEEQPSFTKREVAKKRDLHCQYWQCCTAQTGGAGGPSWELLVSLFAINVF